MATLTETTTDPLVIGGFTAHVIASSGRVNVAGDDAVRFTGGSAHLLVDGEVLVRNGAGVALNTIAGAGNNLMVTVNGVILASGASGVGVTVTGGAGNAVVNDGLIFGIVAGIRAGSFSDSIRNQGTVTAVGTGLSMTLGSKSVNNSGEISATGRGVEWAAPNVSFLNTGQIGGGLSGGVFVSADGHGRLVNHGEIAATGAGVTVIGANAEFRLVNHGVLIGGGDVAYTSNEAADRVDVVRNSGLISGDVRLGGGDDVYRGAGQGAVDGTVSGGAGDDLLVGSNADDTLDGGDGADVLRGRGGDDVLDGGDGPDLLIGGRGDDVLRGGLGPDVLLGGPGPDIFVFHRNAGDNRITDFRRGQNDKIDLTAFGLAPGGFAKLQAAASNAGGGATLIDLDALGGQGSVLVKGMGFAGLTATDFIFI